MKSSSLVAIAACIALLGAGCKRAPDAPYDDGLAGGETVAGDKLLGGGSSDAGDDVPEFRLPTRKNWEDGEEMSPSELGAQIDEAMRELKMAWGAVKTDIIDNRPESAKKGSGTGTSDIKIQDSETFSIHYHLPEILDHNWIIADGTDRARLEAGEWSDLPAFRSSTQAPGLSESEVLSWPEQFPRRILEYFSDGKDHWSPLLEAWESNTAGYEVVVTKKVVEREGRDVPFVRIVATRSAEPLTEIEVIIDGETYLPLTIHVSQGLVKDGLRIRWDARWWFSGSFDDDDFVIPAFARELVKT